MLKVERTGKNNEIMISKEVISNIPQLVIITPKYGPWIDALRASKIKSYFNKVRRAWIAPLDREADVVKLLDETFGEHGNIVVTCDAVYNAKGFDTSRKKIEAVGRCLADRVDPNKPVVFGKGVSVILGSFPAVGSVTKRYGKFHPCLAQENKSLHVVMMIKDVPRELAIREAQKDERIKIAKDKTIERFLLRERMKHEEAILEIDRKAQELGIRLDLEEILGTGAVG